jgi:hypothetical protein
MIEHSRRRRRRKRERKRVLERRNKGKRKESKKATVEECGEGIKRGTTRPYHQSVQQLFVKNLVSRKALNHTRSL